MWAKGEEEVARRVLSGRRGAGTLLAEGHLAQHKHTNGLLARSKAVVAALTGHVCEVDPLAKHVAGGRGLGRGDPQAVGEDAAPAISQSVSPSDVTLDTYSHREGQPAAPVGKAAAVPEQLPVADG